MKYFLLIFIVFFSFNAFSSKRDSLLYALKIESNKQKLVDLYNQLSKEYKSINPDSSLYFIKKSLKLSIELKYDKGEAGACFNYGAYFRTIAKLDSSLFWYQKSLSYYNACNDTMEVSRTLNSIGNIYSEKRDFLNAIKYFKQSLSYKILIKDKKGIGINLYNIGNTYFYDIRNYKLGLENYTKAIEIFTEINYNTGLASCLNSMGNLYEEWGNYNSAIESYNRALKLEENDEKKIDLYNNMGNVFVKTQKYDTALFNYSKALEISKLSNSLLGQAISLKNLGLVYSEIENIEKSNVYLKEALAISEKIQLKDVEAEVLSAIGYCYLFQQECKKSLDYFLKSQKIATEIDYKSVISNNYIFISESYMCLGEGKKAKEYYNKHIDAQEIGNKELNDLQIKYETEKQDKEIQLLNKQKQLSEAQLTTKIAESKTQKIIIAAALFFIIIFIVSIILIARQYRQKRKANELLAAQNKQIIHQNEEITTQRDKLSEQKLEIQASINYALRIQQAVLPIGKDSAEIMLGDYFLIFKPKDIVAGDYFWTKKVNEYLIIAVADCTGHGVPGAFMSMLGVSFLNEIVRKPDVTQANDILHYLRLYVIDALKQKGRFGEQKDGMDMSICVINVNTLELQYAGANNPLYIIRKNISEKGKNESDPLDLIEEIKADKMPVAIYEKMNDYTNHSINLEVGDKIYLFTDGYADQFGGVKGKKYMYKPFKRLLAETSDLSIKEQGDQLEKVLYDWINHKDKLTSSAFDQTDDITVFGLEIMQSVS